MYQNLKTDCHFLHNSEKMTAALSDCHDGFSGHIIQNGHILELRPLNDRMKTILANYHHTETNWHIITRKPASELPEFEEEFKLPANKSSEKVAFGMKGLIRTNFFDIQ